MKLKLLHFLSAAILAMAATTASADPIVIGSQVPGSDPSSEPCTPKERTDDYHKQHFAQDLSGSEGNDFDVVLFGDSITDFWNNPSLALDGDPINYAAAFNMGIGSDRVQNLLWRLRNGALDGYTTKYFTLMVGINNGHQKCIDHNEHADRAEDVAESIRLMLCEMATKHPDAKILLMPILPYSFDSRYFEAAEVTAMSEAVNDYILQFVDNKRVFWVDLRSQYLQQNSMPDKVCYREGGHGGYDAVGLCLHPEFFTYSDFWKPALTNAMHKYLSVPAGQAHVADPSVGYAKAAPNADGAGSATITVFGVNLGTDANANAVTSYAIDYELDGGAKTRALSGQTGTRASFAIPNVALGDHTCKVTVTTADDKELVTLLDFTMTEPWYASPLPTDDSAIRTDGTLEYAYAPAACTVNGVAFAAAGNNNANISGDISWPYSQTSGASAPSSVTGAYYELLNRCWWANQGDKEVTLKNLTAGRSYLVQIFGYRNYNGDSKAHVWIKESYWDPNFIKVYGDGWSCGGTLTGTFTATGSTKTFTITSDGNYGINGIQVRDLGDSGVPVVVLPKIGSVSVSTNETAATVFLSGIVMGTDDAGTNATSYSVSYKLNGGALTTALTAQTAATASFSLASLADGEYTCAVSITTDKNKTSAEKTVSFRIGTPPPPVVAPSIGSAAANVVSSNATITLSDIVLGTDDEGAAATSYAVSYALNGGAAVAALANQIAASASFQIADLADGSYVCEVTITTDKGKTATKSVSFAISTSGGGGGGSAEEGWTGEALGATSASIRTDGTLKYAYAYGTHTVNGVTFSGVGSGLINNENCVVWENTGGAQGATPSPPSDIVEADYKNLLGHCWWANPKGRKIQLNNLESGKQYLVQIIAFNQTYTTQSATAPDGTTTVKFGGTGWEYGSSLVGVFTASGASEEFTIEYSGNACINAIQVRELDAGGATVVEPSIGSAAAEVNGTTATISLSGVVMGTDDEGTNATSYAVSYSLNGAAAVTALQNQSGATASFEIGNLADGDYTCLVSITTDRNKTSAEKSVSFTIGTTPPPVVAPSIAAAAASVGGSNATVSLSGIVLGTDDEGVAATSYAVSYSLNGAAAVTALQNQSGATASFEIGNLADGDYTCLVSITTDKGKTASKTVSFTIDTAGGGGTETGWTAQAMDDGGLAFSKEGDLAYAYSLQGLAVNGIPFSKANPIVVSDSIAFDPGYTDFDGSLGNEGVSDTALGLMLGNAWYWKDTSTDTQTVTLTLKDLTVGHRYLVQILSHNTWTSGMRISAGGCEPQPVHGPDAAGGKYGALLTGVFTALATTEDVAITFSGSTSSMRPVNAVQVRDLGEVFVPVVEPSIGTLSAALSGPTAVIVLGDVEKGTDDEGVAATSYAVSYALDGGEPVEKLWNQTGWSAWFNVTNLADGAHTVEVTIATDAGGVASKTVSFMVDSTAPATTAWIAQPMSMNGDTIRTDGDLLYAEAPNSAVVNGVPFKRTPYLKNASFSVSPVEADFVGGSMMDEGYHEGFGYGYLLGHAWYWDSQVSNVTVEVTLEGLTPGKNYLVQLVSHNWWYPQMRVAVSNMVDGAAAGTEPLPVGTQTEVEVQDHYVPFRYGTSIVGIFTASEPTQSFRMYWIGSMGEHPLNALQVRDLGLAVPVVVEPSIGDASAAVDGTTAVVTLSGVVKGTGDDCEPASSYSVTYALDGGAPVTVLEGRTGATAAFALPGLADGDHVCVVSIETDRGKTSEAKTVRIEIGSEPFEWKTEPMDPAGETICTNGVRVWAYCRGADGGQVIANGVSFTSYGNLTSLPSTVTLPFSVSPSMTLCADDWGDEGVAGGLGKILSNAFYVDSDGSRTFTLRELEKGHTYLVQLIMHKSGSGTKAQSPFNVADHVQFGQTGADDTWKLGGSLIGTFLAESDTHTFTVDYDGDFSALNAIQLRDLGVTVATESDPSVEAVSAKRKGTTATVTLSGVAMGTDANRHPATSYAVSYRLDGGAWTTVLPGENGETASFELAGLEYRTYVCEVKIETDVGKSTEPQSVTLAFAKADGLAIVFFDVEKEALAFDMGSESSVRALLPNADDIYCTLVTSTNLADVVWTPALPSLAWKANELPLADETGWTWVGVDTADAVRFFRVALTPAPLAADDEVVFK